MATKPLSKLKHGERIVSAFTGLPMMFDELRRATFLDVKTLQTALARLVKHGYVHKDTKGQWNATSSDSELS